MNQPLKLKIGNIFTTISDPKEPLPLSSIHLKELERELSFRPQGYMFSPAFQRWIKDAEGNPIKRAWGGWKPQFWSSNRNGTFFPSGLLSIALKFFSKHNMPVQIYDYREKPEQNFDVESTGEFEYRDYQLRVIHAACNRTRGIIQAATGCGKTVMALGIIEQLKVAPFMFFVTSIDLLEQAKESFERALLFHGSSLKVGQIGGGVIDIQDVNVCTIQTAVRALGKHWDKNTRFDSDDADDKTPIGQHRKEIQGVIREAKAAICDECISGDAFVTTRSGPVRISELYKHVGKEVLSFSNNSAVWKKITRFYPKGQRKVLRIALSDGRTIRCTNEHPIMTNRGWILAGEIRVGELILCSANAVAAKKSLSQEDILANIPSIYSGIRYKNVQKQNGNKFSMMSSREPHCANAAVDNKCNYTAEMSSRSLDKREANNTIDSSMDMINVQPDGISSYLTQSNRPYLELFLGTHRFHSRQKGAKTLGSTATMDFASRDGRSLSPHILAGCLHDIGSMTTEGSETERRHSERAATQNFSAFILRYTKQARNVSQRLGLMPSEESDSHGGFATTAMELRTTSRCIQKDSQKKKSNSRPHGFRTSMDQVQFINTEAIVPYMSGNKQDAKLSQKSESTCRNVCDTNYVAVESIGICDEECVFDISVEDTHCFFANGILVHNCQHWRASTCQMVARELKSAYYTYGFSATPYRDDGDDMMIQACFGKKIAVITATELIEHPDKWLVRPNIKMVHIKGKRTKFKQWQSIYKDRVVENDYYNGCIANIANAYIGNERLVLVLVQQVSHGKELASMIPGAQFLSGKSTKSKRSKGLKQLRGRHISCIVSTSLPGNELIMVRSKGIVNQMTIGDLCNNYSEEVLIGNFETLSSIDGLTYVWQKITQTHVHKLKNNIVRVETDRGEDVYVTENHSLMTPKLQQVQPGVGKPSCVPQGIPKSRVVENLNLVNLLSTIDDSSIEIEVLGLSQPKIRKLKSEYNYIYNDSEITLSKSTKTRVRKSLNGKTSRYKLAIRELLRNFSYYKRRYRAKLSDVVGCSNLFAEFECRIYIRRSRKKFSLPTHLPVSPELGLISGLMCAEGHIKHHTWKSHKSIYAFDFAAKTDNSIDGKNDKEKKEIRSIFKNAFTEVFGDVEFSETSRLIKFRGKLPYYLFSVLGHTDANGEKRIPDYIYNSPSVVQENFLWGFYLGDGSKKINYRSKDKNWSGICLHNSSRPLIVGVSVLLQMLQKDYYCSSSSTCHKRRYTITIKDSILRLVPQRIRDNLDYSSSHRLQKKVELMDSSGTDTVYDISVDESHNFLGGMLLCHNTIFDEGIDVRPLDTVILAGQGRSQVRAMQRVGRICRPFTYPDGSIKSTTTAIDPVIHDRYLLDHANIREKMYRTEPAYRIEHIEDLS